jgi:DNA-binding CsgD family transcriptional regulator
MGRSVVIGGLLALQFACAVFVLYDLGSSVFGIRVQPMSWALYESMEAASALGLVLGAGLSAYVLIVSLRARRQAEDRLRAARGAFYEVIEERFDSWSLTPAERDVALMSIKGFSTKEIARLRNTSEGTTKAQTAAIYRKAEVGGRAQLLSLFVDEFMGDGLEQPRKPRDRHKHEAPHPGLRARLSHLARRGRAGLRTHHGGRW